MSSGELRMENGELKGKGEKWERVRLNSLGKIITGNTPSTKEYEYYENEDIPFYKPSDINDNHIVMLNEANTYLDVRAQKKLRILPKNTVLVTCIGIIGKVAITTTEASATNQQINAIIPNEKIINSKFLAYAISKQQKHLQDKANAPVVPIINKKDFSETEIPLPPLETQKKIADELDKISGLIEKRKSQIEKLDLLIKAKFVEMFGDPVKYVNAESVCEFITKGTTPKPNDIYEEFSKGLIPYLKVYNLSFNGKLLFDERQQYITSETHESLLKRSKVYKNDVLMNIVGPPLGKFSIITEDNKEYNINQAIVIFRAKETVNPKYLLYALMKPETLQPFINSAVGVRQQNLSLLQCRQLKIPLPSLNLQNKFAEFVEKVEKTKQDMQKALEVLELLYKQRMQEYFE